MMIKNWWFLGGPLHEAPLTVTRRHWLVGGDSLAIKSHDGVQECDGITFKTDATVAVDPFCVNLREQAVSVMSE